MDIGLTKTEGRDLVDENLTRVSPAASGRLIDESKVLHQEVWTPNTATA
ncbi:MAG: hypothetical protein NTW53_16400 [Burkholderiales bacterium]|nr:hypothetical protein [Burkholderiales bacterium]